MVLMLALSVGCVRSKVTPTKAPIVSPVLETVDDHAILQLPVVGFEKLSLKDKLLAYHLYAAAVAGRDIVFDQIHRNNLAVREICEQILLHSNGIDQTTLGAVASYLKLQYLNVGLYGKFTFAKFLPPGSLTYEKLEAAALSAHENGATYRLAGDVPVGTYVRSLQTTMFDPDFENYSTTRSPGKGRDIISASANNLYERGLRLSDLKNFKDHYLLNARLVREHGKIVEQVYRTGDPSRKIPVARPTK